MTNHERYGDNINSVITSPDSSIGYNEHSGNFQGLQPRPPEYVIFASGGNDSIALVWFAHLQNLQNVIVAYSNTSWAHWLWASRIERFQKWVESLGFSFVEIPSIGMEALVNQRKGWPANGMQFCTTELKIKPAQVWLDSVDPSLLATCMIGIRREESKNRRTWPLRSVSENHGGRELWCPLVDVTEYHRNQMLRDAGWHPLPHRSRECSPCVNANRKTFRDLDASEIAKVRRVEAETHRTMFRPQRFNGAVGIDEVIKWANSPRGHYHPDQDELDFGCDSGMCGA